MRVYFRREEKERRKERRDKKHFSRWRERTHPEPSISPGEENGKGDPWHEEKQERRKETRYLCSTSRYTVLLILGSILIPNQNCQIMFNYNWKLLGNFVFPRYILRRFAFCRYTCIWKDISKNINRNKCVFLISCKIKHSKIIFFIKVLKFWKSISSSLFFNLFYFAYICIIMLCMVLMIC